MPAFETLWSFTVHPLELILRGSVMYLGLVLVLRFVLRRDLGSLGVVDVLFIVLVADASQNAMAGEYRSLADGAVLVGTLVGLNVALDWLSFRFRWWRNLTDPPPLPLIRDGRLLRRNLRKEWITADELFAKLRERGLEDATTVKAAHLESSGELSVVRYDDDQMPRGSPKRPKHAPGLR